MPEPAEDDGDAGTADPVGFDGSDEVGEPRDAPPERMPRWVPRAILLGAVAFVGVGIVDWLFLRLRDLLVMLVVALFLSFALEPAVNRLSARGLRRGLATGLVFGACALCGVVFVGAVGTLVVTEVSEFVEEAPDYLQDLEDRVNDTLGTEFESDELADELTRADGPLEDLASDLANNALTVGQAAVNTLFKGLTILLFTYYLVAEGPQFRRAICSFLPPNRQRTVLRTWEIAIEKTGGYIYSRALLAALSAVATAVFLEVMGVPYALALGLWVGLLSQFVPVVGTYIAGALPVLVALIDDPVEGLWVLGFIVVYQQVENYLFAPRVTARTMELHPAVAFGTVIAGAGLLGAVGAVLALPVAAMLQAVGSTFLERHEVVDSHMTTPRARRPEGRSGRRSTRRTAAPSAGADPAGSA